MVNTRQGAKNIKEPPPSSSCGLREDSTTEATNEPVATEPHTSVMPPGGILGQPLTTSEDTRSVLSTVRSRRTTSSVRRRRAAAQLAAAERLAEIEKKKLDIEEALVRKTLQLEMEDIDESEEEREEEVEKSAEHENVRSRTTDWVFGSREQPPPATDPPTQDARKEPTTEAVSETARQRDKAEDGVQSTGASETALQHPPAKTAEKGSTLEIDSGIARRQEDVVNNAGVSEIALLARELKALALTSRDRCCSAKLPDFSGATADWLAFRSAYQEQCRRFDAIENLARLRRSLHGEAKMVVSHQLLAGGDPDRVMQLLEKKFGRDQDIVQFQMRRMRNLPNITDIPRQLNDFACTIEDVVATLRALNQEKYLHSVDAVQVIKTKMKPLMSKYADFYYPRRGENTPELIILAEFLERESDKIAAAWVIETKDVAAKDGARVPASGAPTGRPAVKQMAHAVNTCAACPHCNSTDHSLDGCGKYEKLKVDERWEIARNMRACYRCLRLGHRAGVCRTKKRCKVAECGRRHHTLLHRGESTEPSPAVKKNASSCVESATCTTDDGDDDGRAMLGIIPVTIYGPRGHAATYAMLDSGASTSLIKTELADRVGAVGVAQELSLAETTTQANHMSRLINLEIAGPTHVKYQMFGAYTVDRMSLLPQTAKDYRHLPHLKGLPIKPYAKVTPEIIIGRNNYHLIAVLETRIYGLGYELPSAERTRLGWVVCGPTGGRRGAARRAAAAIHFVGHTSPADLELAALVKSHYGLEALGVSTATRIHPEEERALQLLENTCCRVDGGTRWEAGLLWRDNANAMPQNRKAALRRLTALEKKMDRDEEFGAAYTDQMQRLIDAGYAQPAVPTTSRRQWYLPHFAVTNPNKPGKVRIVFDAAARVDGRSLNDALLTGPDLLNSLLGVLYRFREGPIAVSADIKEMFLRIKMRLEDRASQRFLWRGWDRKATPTEFEMCSVLFGAASSPTTAIFVKDKNAEAYKSEFPDAVQAVRQQFYMDDYLQSFNTSEEARCIASQVKQINMEGGFELTGWASNDENVLRQIDPSRRKNAEKSLDLQATQEKTLGLRWSPETDTLGFNLSMARVPPEIASGERRPTKRQMLAVIMSIFDPLGLLSPTLTRAKVTMQKVWRSNVEWDDELADDEAAEWSEWLGDLKKTWACRVPRCYFTEATPLAVELHTFCDASEDAYAAVSYFRYKQRDGVVRVALVGSKARVAPLKPTSIPRLELQAALIGARLAATITREHSLKIERRTYWTDSRTVLAWISGDPRRYKPFVAHRLGELDELTQASDWRWVPTAQNVADDATRPPKDFDEEHRWFTGPEFLRQPKEQWPKITHRIMSLPTEELEIKRATRECVNTADVVKPTNVGPTPKPERFSKWLKLVRATAYIFLFIDKCRRRHSCGLEQIHMEKAERVLLQRVQQEVFAHEIACIRAGKPQLPRGSRLQHLSPYLDEKGVLRLRGRASAAPGVDPRTTRPMILCGRHAITRLLVQHHHVLAHHGNPETVVNNLRQLYWILQLRPTVRAVEHACQACRVRRATPLVPPMGDLPAARLSHHHRPFTYCGMDYFGPMDVSVGRRREKRYGALFTCLVTRAVHVEVAANLTTDSAISALRRMMARRGPPAEVYSDNGTNLRGAAVELRRAWAELDLQQIQTFALNRGVNWRFIPPGAPFMGGAWERLVGSMKRALSATLHQRAPTDEVLATLLAEAEHTVNARPLTHVSVHPDDPEAITPNHLLLGSSAGLPTPGVFDDADLLRRRPWRAAQRLADIFWQRWLREYLPQLLPRRLTGDRQPPLQPGDVVLIVDPNLPRNVWPRGVVENVHPGRDGHVRVADVRTLGGVLRRPARKIVRLPVATVDSDARVDRGENVDDGR